MRQVRKRRLRSAICLPPANRRQGGHQAPAPDAPSPTLFAVSYDQASGVNQLNRIKRMISVAKSKNGVNGEFKLENADDPLLTARPCHIPAATIWRRFRCREAAILLAPYVCAGNAGANLGDGRTAPDHGKTTVPLGSEGK